MRILKYTDNDRTLIDVGSELEDLRSIIGGHLETVTFPEDIILICDEEGKLKYQSPTLIIKDTNGTIYDVVVGVVLFVSFDGVDDWTDIQNHQIEWLESHIERVNFHGLDMWQIVY